MISYTKRSWLFLLPAGLVLAGLLLTGRGEGSSPVGFEAEVKPLLNKHCLKCHGGVKESGGLNFITRESALGVGESGKPAIVPGNPEASEFIRRLRSHDPDERMPLDAPPLDEAAVDVLTRWVAEGAVWERHWAYRPVRPVPVPEPRRLRSGGIPADAAVVTDLDRFIRAGWADQGLSPTAPAAPDILLRRVSLDLTGLPAPEHLAEQYLAAPTEAAYRRLVDSLLAAPAYGEHWASLWLDLARYSDSKGYEIDSRRNVWRYRDWVIRSWNADQPYDEFLRWQMAGDRLAAADPTLSPAAAEARYLATTFHRLTSTNDEGGSDNEEFRTAAVLDRVSTVWEGVLGTTLACAQCHGHPYDPFTQEDYYRSMALFNNTRDEDTREDYPVLRHLSDSALVRLDSLRDWMRRTVSPAAAESLHTFVRTWQPSLNSLRADQMERADLYAQGYLGLRHRGSARLAGVDLTGHTELIYRFGAGKSGGIWRVRTDRPDGPLLFEQRIPGTGFGWEIAAVTFPAREGVHDLYFSFEHPGIAPTDLGVQFDWLHLRAAFPAKATPEGRYWETVFRSLVAEPAEATPVMFENPPAMSRPTRLFDRGNWMSPAGLVLPGLPDWLLAPGQPPVGDREAFAAWLTHPQNPLTARTLVNRLWAALFGKGLAFTLEDLGSQGIPPTHPELLDWLSWRFMHTHRWQLKPLLRDLVLSQTYRLDATASADALAADPYNDYYARGTRIRLSAEQLRDQALALAGLLSPRMYGPPVMPPQPDGIWKTPYSGEQWTVSPGEDRYRRSVYTFWKRSAPYPAAMIFDAAPREVCTARRVRTNTPLQALVTLNDDVFFEAACHLARWMERQGTDPAARVAAGYRRATGLVPEPAVLQPLLQLHDQAVEGYRNGTADPQELVFLPPDERTPETAAMALLANALLNLDAVMVRN